MKKNFKYYLFLFLMILSLTGCGAFTSASVKDAYGTGSSAALGSTDNIPAYTDEAYVILNDNEPLFSDSELKASSFESYGELDSLGRCTAATACIGLDLMPTEERGNISQVKPSGWQTVKYDFVDGKYLYNRCHLIGYQLSGENANEKNLITGTRYMNVEGMLPFENMVADYVHETGNHVMYRVTPLFEENNLVASGVQMEARSVEDDGDGILFNVFCYNVQPGVVIDYGTGDSSEDETVLAENDGSSAQEYILNTNSRKFHLPSCSGVDDIKKENRQDYTGSRELLIKQGYSPCGRCNP